MAYSNVTPNYDLPQYVADDYPSWLTDFNDAMSKIDRGMKTNKDNVAGQETRLQTVETNINTLNENMSQIDENIIRIDGVADQAEKNSATALLRTESLESTVEQHTTQIQTINNSISGQGTSIDSINNDISNINEKDSAQDNDINTLKNNVSTLQGDVSSLQGQIDGITMPFTTMKVLYNTPNYDLINAGSQFNVEFNVIVNGLGLVKHTGKKYVYDAYLLEVLPDFQYQSASVGAVQIEDFSVRTKLRPTNNMSTSIQGYDVPKDSYDNYTNFTVPFYYRNQNSSAEHMPVLRMIIYFYEVDE